MLDFLYKLDPLPAFFLFLAENMLIVAGVVMLGYFIQKQVNKSTPFRISAKEYGTAFLTLFINTCITSAGFLLWNNGYISFSTAVSFRMVIDFFILLLIMDLVMYLLHLIIHHSAFYKPVHAFHHVYDKPSPIDLFVLSPLEAFAFGVLWLILIFFYTCNFYAVVAYLVTNVVFGMLGHLSVEPFPRNWLRIPGLNLICTSTFHYIHHQDGRYNFGFYTTIWDRIGRTLAPDYTEQFIKNKEEQA
jgi:sterol desaturase/sphingolipid hydroxylase (fatty acid hydroxylase superfamily)